MLILASQSQSRQNILRQAGVTFETVVSGVNEGQIKSDLQKAGKSQVDIALALAIAKAMVVSQEYPDAYVIGADQICVCDGKAFDKAENMTQARQQLEFFRGKTHHLISAAVLVYKQKIMWQTVVQPELTMRHFSDIFLDTYIDTLKAELLRSVGCYQVEGLGAQLFEVIKGDIFTIMGLPLLPLLAALREFKLIRD